MILIKNVLKFESHEFIKTNVEIDSTIQEEMDGEGMYWLPPLVELFADFKEPGLEHVYSIKEGSEAMLKGGFGTVMLDPNSHPVVDQEEVVEWVLSRVEHLSLDVRACGAITKGQNRKELSEMSSMLKSGAQTFSNGVRPLPPTAILKSVLEYSARFDVRIFILPWETDLCGPGLVHEDEKSSILGLQGWPASAERLTVIKCLELAMMTRSKIHLRQLTIPDSVQLVKSYQKQGVDCTFDVNPSHLLRSNEHILSLNVNDKVIPPLRSKQQSEEMKELFQKGEIPVLSSQHRPVLDDFKVEAFGDAKPGEVVLETAFSQLLLLSRNQIDFHRAVKAHSIAAGELLGSKDPYLVKGQPAGVLFDPSLEYISKKSDFMGHVSNSHLLGGKVTGKVIRFYLSGQQIMPKG